MARAFSTHRAANILVIGGGYGGLSAALNLLRLGSGKSQLSCPLPPPELDWAPPTPPQIHLIDERDGICMSTKKALVILYVHDANTDRPFDGSTLGPNKLDFRF